MGHVQIFVKIGVPLIGRYVQTERARDNPYFLPQRILVGRVIAIENNILFLDDHADGYARVLADETYLESRTEVFDEVIGHILGSKAGAVLASAGQAAEQLRLAPAASGKLKRLWHIYVTRQSLKLYRVRKFESARFSGHPIRIFRQRNLCLSQCLSSIASGSRKYNWSERGLKESGPYDQRTFSPKKLNIAVICQAKFEGQVDRFVAKFLDGMPDAVIGENRVARYGDGFIRRFHLEKPRVAFFTTPTASAADYSEASRKALQQAADEGINWNLALVQVEEEFKKCGGDSNPYYVTKAILLKRDVAVQSVRLETMVQPDESLVFSMNHLSLATYAKLGGTPWLLAAKQTVAHELVIGLGSHTVSGSRIGSRKRFVGITTVFSSDGSSST